MTDLTWLTQGLDRLSHAPTTARSPTPDWSADPAVRDLQAQFAAQYGTHLHADWAETALAPVPAPQAPHVEAPIAEPLRPLDEWWGYAGLVTLALILLAQGIQWAGGWGGESSSRSAPSHYVPVVDQFDGPPIR